MRIYSIFRIINILNWSIKRKREQSFMKLSKILLIILLSTLVFIGCTSKKTVSQQGKIVKITEKGEIEKINDGYLYFAYKECEPCKKLTPLVEKEIKNKKVKIYYFDLYTMQKDEIYSTEELISLSNQYNVSTVPIIINIKNNKELSRFPTDINQSDDKLTKELSQFLKED